MGPNRSQTGYEIPLVSQGQTVWLFPDFLVWIGDTVICVDTKATHILERDARRKLSLTRMFRRGS